MESFDEINALYSLFLVKIEEPEENRLLITVKASTVSEQREDIIISGKNIGKGRRVERNGPGTEYEIYFDTYASYGVTNESFKTFEKEAVRSGRLFCIYSKSSYLEYIRNNTIVAHIRDGELKHFAINCEMHIVDITSMSDPVIKKI